MHNGTRLGTGPRETKEAQTPTRVVAALGDQIWGGGGGGQLKGRNAMIRQIRQEREEQPAVNLVCRCMRGPRDGSAFRHGRHVFLLLLLLLVLSLTVELSETISGRLSGNGLETW